MVIGRGILPVKGKLVLAGEPKANKSWVAMNLALAMAKGEAPFGAYYAPGEAMFPVYGQSVVLYMDMEMGDQGIKDRCKIGLASPQNTLGVSLWMATRDVRFRVDTPEGRQLIEEEVCSVRPRVLILDPLAKFHGSNENDSTEMGKVLRFGDYLCDKYELALIWIHHTSKPDYQHPKRGGDKLRGSSAIFADADTVALVTRQSADPEDPEPLLELEFILRRGQPLRKQYIRRNANGIISYIGEGSVGRAAASKMEAR